MAMTPAELLEKALNGESLDGDDIEVSDGKEGANDGAAVDAAKAYEPSQEQGNAGEKEPPQGKEPEGAPIASKSGAYTIPYEKLDEARTRAKTLESENETLRAQVAELTAKQQANLGRAEDKAQDRADAGQKQTTADQNLDAAKAAIGAGVDVAIFGDFSEEALAKGVAALTQSLVEQARDQLRAELREENAKALKPLQEREAKQANDGHYGSIYEKHPDANEIVQSAEFAAWHKSLPGFTRSAVAAVLDSKTGGTAAEVIEVFDTFKAQTGKAAAPVAKGDAKAPEVQRRVPNSLSEAAGEQHQDLAQQVMASAGSNPNALLERMQDMTPEQVDRLLNSI